jgi:nucleotide-binding universal stress UspA family protein
MKTILVPTDFSETANNALRYAVELAKFTKAKLILFHAYHVPVPTTETPVMLILPQELEQENIHRIKKLEKQIIESAAGIKTECIVRAGFASDEIKDIAKEKNVDLIVMGITGASKAAQVLLGSNATAVMKKVEVPVLVVPNDARYREVEKIVLACNYSEPVNAKAVLKVKAFAKLLNAKVLVLDVEKPVPVPMYETEPGGEKLEKLLKGVEHVLFFSPAEDIADGINTFVDDHNCDWLIMIPHKHTGINGLFHKSNTKKMAFHTHIPLLSIHE